MLSEGKAGRTHSRGGSNTEKCPWRCKRVLFEEDLRAHVRSCPSRKRPVEGASPRPLVRAGVGVEGKERKGGEMSLIVADQKKTGPD